MVSQEAIFRLVVSKGIFTKEEFLRMLDAVNLEWGGTRDHSKKAGSGERDNPRRRVLEMVKVDREMKKKRIISRDRPRFMGRKGRLRGVENRLRKDLEKTTNSLSALGRKYGVSKQAVSNFVRSKGIKRPKREHPEECPICQAMIGIASKPHSDFIPPHKLTKQLGIVRATFLKHIRILRKRGIVSKKFGTLQSMHSVPYAILKEIFPRRLERRALAERVYNSLKNMILSGELMKGQRLAEEKLAQKFNLSRTPVRNAFLQLEKDKLVVRKGREGIFVA